MIAHNMLTTIITSSDSLSVSVPPNMEQSSNSRNIGNEVILSVLENRNVLPIRIEYYGGYTEWQHNLSHMYTNNMIMMREQMELISWLMTDNRWLENGMKPICLLAWMNGCNPIGLAIMWAQDGVWTDLLMYWWLLSFDC